MNKDSRTGKEQELRGQRLTLLSRLNNEKGTEACLT